MTVDRPEVRPTDFFTMEEMEFMEIFCLLEGQRIFTMKDGRE